MATAETSGQRLERLKSLVPGLTNDVIGEWFGLTAQAVQKWTKAEVPRNRFATIVEKTGVRVSLSQKMTKMLCLPLLAHRCSLLKTSGFCGNVQG